MMKEVRPWLIMTCGGVISDVILSGGDLNAKNTSNKSEFLKQELACSRDGLYMKKWGQKEKTMLR